MAIFALVHGSMHGGWCWRDLVPELTKRGHAAIAPDLPCEDAQAGLREYADAVEALIEANGPLQDLVLVGHSLGSRTIPAVASRRPGCRMVFLCSAPTGMGLVDTDAFSEMVTPEYAKASLRTRPDGTQRIETSDAKHFFFHDCDAATASWAAKKLRWQGSKPLGEPAFFEDWPDGPMNMILAPEDRVARFEWLADEASRWPLARPPILLPGGHSPMLARPAELAEALLACTDS
ncbi:MAG: alpha/beta hydrolase [Deltaproteobacteria bacterium]|nr:alpha/beta hydrolase [Deltaproteobacteria bacterium]